MTKLYKERVTEKIIGLIKSGKEPWNQNNSKDQEPFNPLTEKRYSSINNLYLRTFDYKDPRWLTYEDIKEFDGSVKEGEKGTVIQYWKFEKEISNIDSQGNEFKEIVKLDKPTITYAVVFNAEQVSGLPKLERNKEDSLEKSYKIIENKPLSIEPAINKVNKIDLLKNKIFCQVRDQYNSEEDYLSTTIGIITKFVDSKNKGFIPPFGTIKNAKNQLTQSISTMFLTDELNLSNSQNKPNSAFEKKWIKILESDPTNIFRICLEADKLKERVLEMSIGNKKEIKNEISKEDKSELLPEKTNILPEKSISEQTVKSNKEIKEKQSFGPSLSDSISIKRENKNEIQPNENSKNKEAAKENDSNHISQKPIANEVFDKKTFLYVPYDEKEQASDKGAKWDKINKSWYAPEGTSIQPLKLWINKNHEIQKPTANPISEFSIALKDAGLNLPGDPIMDGKLHRVSVTEGKKGNRDGAYLGHLDGVPNGFIQNFYTGLKNKWVCSGVNLSKEEQEKLRITAIQRKEERANDLLKVREEASIKAKKLFNAGKSVSAHNPYLVEKCIFAIGIKQNDKGDLLVPVSDENKKIWSIQTISLTQKSFLKGGKIEGNYFVLDSKDTIEKQSSIIISESYSTAATIHEATGRAVICAFNAGNLLKVAEKFNSKYPDKGLVIAGDDDKHRTLINKPNVGKIRAEEAAKTLDATAVFPVFSHNKISNKFTDFNDLQRCSGNSAVKRQIENAIGIEFHKKNQSLKNVIKIDKNILSEKFPTVKKNIEKPLNKGIEL